MLLTCSGLVIRFAHCSPMQPGWLYTDPNLTREIKERTVGGLIIFCGAWRPPPLIGLTDHPLHIRTNISGASNRSA
jgi:hypothetical protein